MTLTPAQRAARQDSIARAWQASAAVRAAAAADRLAAGVKTCSRCGQTWPLEYFNLRPRCTDGRNSWCKDCSRADAARHHARRRQLRIAAEAAAAIERLNAARAARLAARLQRQAETTRRLQLTGQRDCAWCGVKADTGLLLCWACWADRSVDRDRALGPGWQQLAQLARVRRAQLTGASGPGSRADGYQKLRAARTAADSRSRLAV